MGNFPFLIFALSNTLYSIYIFHPLFNPYLYVYYRTLLELLTDSMHMKVELNYDILKVILTILKVNMINVKTFSTNSFSIDVWTHLVITFQNTTGGREATQENTVVVDFFVNDTKSWNASLQMDFPTAVLSAKIGSGYFGVVQDVGLYLPSLIESDLDPKKADFLPQCLCYPEDIYSADPSLCGNSSVQQNR